MDEWRLSPSRPLVYLQQVLAPPHRTFIRRDDAQNPIIWSQESVPRKGMPQVGSAQLQERSNERAGLGEPRGELQGHPRVKVMRDTL
jgi:hypothetical protein